MSTRRPIVIRPVAKPVKQMTSAARRSLELTQLETRYKSTYQLVKETDQESVIRLAILPSDPDFPFALEMLQIQLKVPKTYPDNACLLQVLNPDLPKLYATYIEKRYHQSIQASTGHTTLVRQMNWLDHHIASLLQEMEETIKKRHQQHEALKAEYTIDIIKTNNKEEIGTLMLTEFNHEDALGKSKLYIKYHMPILYPLEPCTIEIENDLFDQRKAACIIKAFDCQHENRDLIGNLNWLNHHLEEVVQQEPLKVSRDDQEVEAVDEKGEIESNKEEEKTNNHNVDKMKTSSEQSENQSAENITDLRLIQPKLERISLFHCVLLHLMVKCNQCNDIVGMELLAEQHDIKQVECHTCHQKLKARFESDLVHQGMVSVGTLELAGCTAYDMLSSQFRATCGQCMADLNDLIAIAPHDLPQITYCQSCQSKITVKLNDFQFMQVNDRDERLLFNDPMTMMLLNRKKSDINDGRKEEESEEEENNEDTNDNIKGGSNESLPLEQGACIHDKNNRWLRFNCCKNIYPCTTCHDENEQHSSDILTHYVCGLCSRENVAVESGKLCNCHDHVVNKKAGGARNLEAMHRKDHHKHKRKGLKKSALKKHDRKK